MTMQFRDLAAQAAADGAIDPGEIAALRGLGWADGRIDPEEAESLFLANEQLPMPDAEWAAFFVEALSAFVVETVEPRGYVDQVMADELIARIDHDGKVASLTELELLVRVLELSTSTPASLKAYALRQIEEAVLSGEGPTRGGSLDPEGINAAECTLLRRMVFAAGGDRPAAVSKAEAELLFRIKDATLYEVNSPEWQKLFVQGVANYLLGFGGDEPLSAERAGELAAFMASEGAGVGGFLSRMATSKPGLDGAFGSLLGKDEDYLEDHVEGAETSAAFEPCEQAWLRDRLDADEELDDLEKALIAFIDAETDGAFVPRPS
ncbi:MAG: hypothetical protein JSR28_11895 [Proteobacteria bacterium]|nr:hypothetical protein [Pseudomonadota bacterium]